MKRLSILVIVLISLVCLYGCGKNDKQDFYGKYTFKEVSYLSPLSSSTPSYINEKMSGTKFTIEEDLFKIEFPENSIEIKSPKYVKEEIPQSTSALSNVREFIGNEVKNQYTIYNEEGYPTEWRLYASSDCLWIAMHDNNIHTKKGSEPIRYIYKLSK